MAVGQFGPFAVGSYDGNSQVKPFLAQSIDHNADYTQWTLRLRPDVKLHNGRAVDADVVIRNQIYLSKSRVTRTAYAYGGMTGFTKKDALTVVVQLNKPFVDWPVFLYVAIPNPRRVAG